MARYDEATFELAKKLRAKAVQRLREEGFDADDREPRGTPTFRTETDSADETPGADDAAQDASAPAALADRGVASDNDASTQATVQIAHAGRWDVDSGARSPDVGSAFVGISDDDYVNARHVLKDFPGGRGAARHLGPLFARPIVADQGHGRTRLYDGWGWVRERDGYTVIDGKPGEPARFITVFIDLAEWHGDGERAITRRASRPAE